MSAPTEDRPSTTAPTPTAQPEQTQPPHAAPSRFDDRANAGAPGGYPAPPPRNTGRGFTVAGLVCALVSILVAPIILGPLGIIFGFVGYSKGDPKGKWVGILAIVCTAVGLGLTYLVLKHRT